MLGTSVVAFPTPRLQLRPDDDHDGAPVVQETYLVVGSDLVGRERRAHGGGRRVVGEGVDQQVGADRGQRRDHVPAQDLIPTCG